MTTNLSAIELLNLGDQDRKQPYLNYIWPQTLGIGMGIISACFVNYQLRRPPFSGIHKHVIISAGLTAVLSYITQLRKDYLEEKDAVLRHYVELHPKDFPTKQRRIIGDILEPWIPIR